MNIGAPDPDPDLDRLTDIEYEVVGHDRVIDPNQPAPAVQARPSPEKHDETARLTVKPRHLIA
ncbi:hypothetical protein [Rhodococcus wratislaviensis]|uniref:hypothetical protein n=1 Tax=Rhodococcus wratislaviensis TaxID=44752 RepID=UPI003662F0D2